jgi:hypothetical protein
MVYKGIAEATEDEPALDCYDAVSDPKRFTLLNRGTDSPSPPDEALKAFDPALTLAEL